MGKLKCGYTSLCLKGLYQSRSVWSLVLKHYAFHFLNRPSSCKSGTSLLQGLRSLVVCRDLHHSIESTLPPIPCHWRLIVWYLWPWHVTMVICHGGWNLIGHICIGAVNTGTMILWWVPGGPHTSTDSGWCWLSSYSVRRYCQHITPINPLDPGDSLNWVQL